MPLFCGLGVLATLTFAIVTQVRTTASWLALIALVALLVQLSLYLIVAKPVNQKMTEAVQLGEVPDDNQQPTTNNKLNRGCHKRLLKGGTTPIFTPTSFNPLIVHSVFT